MPSLNPKDHQDLTVVWDMLRLDDPDLGKPITIKAAFLLVVLLRMKGAICSFGLYSDNFRNAFDFPPPQDSVNRCFRRIQARLEALDLPIRLVRINGLGMRVRAPEDYDWPLDRPFLRR